MAIGILEVIKNSKALFIIFIVSYLIIFSVWEINYYYTSSSIEGFHPHEDIYLANAIQYIRDEGLEDKKIHIYAYQKAQPYIYMLLNNRYSPYDFAKNKKVKRGYIDERNFVEIVTQVDNYYFNVREDSFIYDENKVYIVSQEREDIVENLEQIGYQKEELEEFYILKSK